MPLASRAFLSTVDRIPRLAPASRLMAQPQPPTPPRAPTPTPRLQRAPSQLLSVYFGNIQPTSARLERQARQATLWYHQHIEAIPALARDNRHHHHRHLHIIGQVLGLLPPARSASEVHRQYVAAFQAVQHQAAPRPQDIRMSCDPTPPTADPQAYLLQHYDFYILVFAPNGAVESFRRNTPTSVAFTPGNPPDMAKRIQLFQATGADFSKLKALIQAQQPARAGIPDILATPGAYSRSVLKPGHDGKDAWQQAHKPSPQQVQQKDAFHAWVRQTGA